MQVLPVTSVLFSEFLNILEHCSGIVFAGKLSSWLFLEFKVSIFFSTSKFTDPERRQGMKMAAPQLSKTFKLFKTDFKICFAIQKYIDFEFYLHAGCCSISSIRSWPCRLPGRHSLDTRPWTGPRARSDYPRNDTHCSPSSASRSNKQTWWSLAHTRKRVENSFIGPKTKAQFLQKKTNSPGFQFNLVWPHPQAPF